MQAFVWSDLRCEKYRFYLHLFGFSVTDIFMMVNLASSIAFYFFYISE